MRWRNHRISHTRRWACERTKRTCGKGCVLHYRAPRVRFACCLLPRWMRRRLGEATPAIRLFLSASMPVLFVCLPLLARVDCQIQPEFGTDKKGQRFRHLKADFLEDVACHHRQKNRVALHGLCATSIYIEGVVCCVTPKFASGPLRNYDESCVRCKEDRERNQQHPIHARLLCPSTIAGLCWRACRVEVGQPYLQYRSASLISAERDRQ